MAQQEILLQARGVTAAAGNSRAAALGAASNMQSLGISTLSQFSSQSSAASGPLSTELYGVRFYVTPDVTESGSASYIEISDVRQPASYLIYMGSPSRGWEISAKLISRTVEEADRTFRYMNTMRSWRMPETIGGGGVGSGRDTSAPTILNLYGYGQTFKGIPVVMTNLRLEWSQEVDTIKSSNGSDIPIIMSVGISIKEAHQSADMQNFNISSFRAGTLGNW